MINSKSITLFAASWLDQVKPTTRVVELCLKLFPYFDEVVHLKDITSIREYNRFMIEDLHKTVKTDFVMTVQMDGHIINPHLWKNEFLDYDYIGAPWWWHKVCGNGGFSLRSKKFLELSSKLKYCDFHEKYQYCPEDQFLCLESFNRNYFEKNGAKFASMETAIYFSFENPIDELPNHTIKDSFGFHGKNNCPAPISYNKNFLI